MRPSLNEVLAIGRLARTRSKKELVYAKQLRKVDPRLQQHQKKWWEKDIVEIKVEGNSKVRARLERLMGTDIVRLTDRRYMRQLQSKLMDEHFEALNRRMEERENREILRERMLFLQGKLPEDAMHRSCQLKKATQSRRLAKASGRLHKPEYPQDTLEALTEKEIQKQEKEYAAKASFLSSTTSAERRRTRSRDDAILKDIKVPSQIKYESPEVKSLKEIETANELFKFAERIQPLGQRVCKDDL